MAAEPERQNQALKQAFIVGGEPSFVQDTLSKSLAKHGIQIVAHWSWDRTKPPTVWPEGIDLVYICTDMISHKVSNPAMKHCRTVGIPYVNGTRKWAESIARLETAGFPLLAPTPIPAKESDMTIMTKSAEGRASSLAIDNPTQRLYLETLITKPDMSNEELWDMLQAHPSLTGRQFDAQRGSYARKQLGITVTRSMGVRKVSVDVAMFKATAKKIGCTGWKEPMKVYVSKDPIAGPRTMVEEKPSPVTSAALAAPPAPEPEAPRAPMPDRVFDDMKPAPKRELTGMEELKDLLTLVRVKMTEESITELHLTPEGVKFKQVKVVEGAFEV